MRVTAIIIVALALGVSGITFYLVRTYLNEQAAANVPTQQAEAIPTVQVTVAARDLPAGTIIQSGDLAWQPWPDKDLRSEYVVQRNGEGADQIDQFVGSVVRRAIVAGEPVTRGKVFRREDAGFLAGALAPGKRAVAIKITAETGAAGFVLPGDRVDVILSQEIRRRGGGMPMRTSETILHDVRVLAIDQNVNDVDVNAQLGKTATLEVTPKQAEMIAVARTMGKLSLALRSLTSDGDASYARSFTRDRDVSLALGGTLKAERFGKKTVKKAAPKKTTVKVYRANKAVTVEITK